MRDGRRKWPYITPEMEVGGAVRGRALAERETIICHLFFFSFLFARGRNFRWLPIKWKLCQRYTDGLTSEEKPSDLCFYLFKDKLNFNELRAERIFVHSHSIYINVVLETISRRRTKLPPFLYESNYRKLLNKGSSLVSRDLYSMFVLNDVSTTVENPGCLELNPLE